MDTDRLSTENNLLRQAKSGRRIPPFWLVIPVVFLIPIISSVGGALALAGNLLRHMPLTQDLLSTDPQRLVQLAYPQTAGEETLFLAANFVGIYGLLWLWVRFAEKRPYHTMGLAGRRRTASFGRGLAVGFLMFAIVAGGMMLAGWQVVSAWHGGQSQIWLSVGVLLLGWLVQGPAEELLFRGWAMPVLGARYGVWFGVLGSAMMFAALHSFNPNLSSIAMLNLFLFGAFAALYALWEESVWGVFGLHTVWNWVQGNILGMAVSGAPVAGGSLLVLRETGPDWLTGGLFGPEGGLAVTAVLAGGIAVVFKLSRQKKQRDMPQNKAGLSVD